MFSELYLLLGKYYKQLLHNLNIIIFSIEPFCRFAKAVKLQLKHSVPIKI